MLKELEKELNTTMTENGDIAYISTFNKNLDFFGTSGALRNNSEDLESLFRKALHEDAETALKNMFFLRDVRGGNGERNSFRLCLSILAEHINVKTEKEKTAFVSLLSMIAEYGRYDDMLVFLDNKTTEKITAKFIYSTLVKDLNALHENIDTPISLCAKWAPSVNASSAKTREYANKIVKDNEISASFYRKLLATLRKKLDIVETHLTEKDYSFEYEKLPGRALNKYIKAFGRNDRERYDDYISSLDEGKAKAKVDTLYPYEIIEKVGTEPKLAEAQWKAIKRSEDGCNTIVVRDGSGSMWGLPEDVATSLTILYSEQLTGEFKDKFITFSSRPELVDLSGCKTLKAKMKECSRYTDCSNTDLERVYDVIYNASLKVENPDDYIKRIVIVSDMEFDSGVDNVPTYEAFAAKFKKAGLPIPEVVFWNVECRDVHFAASPAPNIKLVSGFSKSVIDMIHENGHITGPEEFMNACLEKYDVSSIMDCLDR